MQVATQQWPEKLAIIRSSAGENLGGRTPVVREDGLFSAPSTGDSRRTLGTPEVFLVCSRGPTCVCGGVCVGGERSSSGEPASCRRTSPLRQGLYLTESDC